LPYPETGGRLTAMTNALRKELFQLSAAERLELVEELWDSIADEDSALQLTPEQCEDPCRGSPQGFDITCVPGRATRTQPILPMLTAFC